MVSEDKLKKCRQALIITSGVCFVIALIIIGASIYLFINKSDLLTYVFMMNVSLPACVLVLSAGCAMVLIALLGALGASLQSKIILAIYCLFVLLVAAAAIIGAICAISAKAQYTDYLRERMRLTLVNNYGANVTTNAYNAYITDKWDYAQRTWYCCGTDDNSWGVYRSSMWYEFQPGSKEYDRPMVPPSCCTYDQYGNTINLQKCQIWADGPPRTQSSSIPNEALLYKGCFTKGKELIQTVSAGIIVMGFAVCAFLLCCFILAGIMLLGLRTQHNRPAVIRQTAYSVTTPSSHKTPPTNGKLSYTNETYA